MPVTKLTNEQKVARVRDTYEKLNRGEYEQASEVFAEGAAWHGYLIGDVKGREAIKAGLEKMRGLNARFDLHDVLANDDHVVALQTLSVRKGELSAQTKQVIVTHVDEDGQIEELWTISNPQDLSVFLPSSTQAPV